MFPPTSGRADRPAKRPARSSMRPAVRPYDRRHALAPSSSCYQSPLEAIARLVAGTDAAADLAHLVQTFEHELDRRGCFLRRFRRHQAGYDVAETLDGADLMHVGEGIGGVRHRHRQAVFEGSEKWIEQRRIYGLEKHRLDRVADDPLEGVFIPALAKCLEFQLAHRRREDGIEI